MHWHMESWTTIMMYSFFFYFSFVMPAVVDEDVTICRGVCRTCRLLIVWRMLISIYVRPLIILSVHLSGCFLSVFPPSTIATKSVSDILTAYDAAIGCMNFLWLIDWHWLEMLYRFTLIDKTVCQCYWIAWAYHKTLNSRPTVKIIPTMILCPLWKRPASFVVRLLPRDAMQSAVIPQYVVCPSVHPSVTFRYGDHIGWNTSKIISRPNSLRLMLGWANPNVGDLVQREHPQI